MDTNLTLNQVETIIANHYGIRKNIIVTNVDWGLLNHEADLLIMNESGYLTEVEIKRSFSDFKADFKKSHHHDDVKISAFYYAVPFKILDKVGETLYNNWQEIRPEYFEQLQKRAKPEYTKHAGLIGYTDGYKDGTHIFHGRAKVFVGSPADLGKVYLEGYRAKIAKLNSERPYGAEYRLKALEDVEAHIVRGRFKLDNGQRFKLARLGSLRVWGIKENIASKEYNRQYNKQEEL